MPHHQHPDCQLCLSNGKVIELAKTEHAFLVQAVRDGEPLPGAYLAVPVTHTTTEPNWFIRNVDFMVKQLGLEIDNRSVNVTKRGGRTLEHFHMWLLARQDELRLGMHGLIERCETLTLDNIGLRMDSTERDGLLAEARRQVPSLQLNGLH